MAKRISEPPVPQRPAQGLYPWHEWTDGSWWEIEQGVDFRCSIKAMQASLWGRALARDPLRLEVRCDGPRATATRLWFRYVPR